MKVYITEETKNKAIEIAEKFLSAGKIKSYGKPESFLHHRGRKTGNAYFWYKIECEE